MEKAIFPSAMPAFFRSSRNRLASPTATNLPSAQTSMLTFLAGVWGSNAQPSARPSRIASKWPRGRIGEGSIFSTAAGASALFSTAGAFTAAGALACGGMTAVGDASSSSGSRSSSASAMASLVAGPLDLTGGGPPVTRASNSSAVSAEPGRTENSRPRAGAGSAFGDAAGALAPRVGWEDPASIAIQTLPLLNSRIPAGLRL